MVIKIGVTSSDAVTHDVGTRTYNYINGDYVGFIGREVTPPETPEMIPSVPLPAGYSTFYEWADAVVAGLATLTKNTLVNLTSVVATTERSDEYGD